MLKLYKCLNYLLVNMAAGVSDSKESTCNTGYLGSILGSGRFPGEGNGNHSIKWQRIKHD